MLLPNRREVLASNSQFDQTKMEQLLVLKQEQLLAPSHRQFGGGKLEGL